MGKKKKAKKKKKPETKGNKRMLLYTGVILLAAVVIIVVITLLAGDNNTGDIAAGDHGEDDYSNLTKPIATIEMENGDLIKVELDPASAPNTVKNFIALANEGFYDGLIFHRVIPGFMIQGGCPQGQGTGGPGYSIRGEFLANNHDNPLSHTRGVMSMARSNHPDSAGSQFFIMVDAAPNLDGQYAAFGMVTEGMEAVDRIVDVDRNQSDKPLEDQVIKRITVETFGVEYALPDKL